jgi:pimeloyl-ACP methyl ester carboxylesterase
MAYHEDRFIDVRTIWTRYRDLGAGPPVVLLHGLGASAESWQYVAGPLSHHYRVLVPDLIGFGYTDKPDIDYTLDAFVDFVLAFMESVGVSGASLVGHSLGGTIALRVAIRHPGSVERLVVASTGGLGEPPNRLLKLLRIPLLGELLLRPSPAKTRQALKLYFHDESYVTEELVDLNYRLISQPGAVRAYLSTIRNTLTASNSDSDLTTLVTEKLDQIEAPTLVLWGEEDRVLSPGNAQVAAQGIRNVEVHLIPEAGHNPMVEQSERFTQAVLDFLASPA